MSHDTTSRLEQIRTLMKQHQIDFYFVPSRDAHNDEYLPGCWKRRSYITGFTGSAGEALIGLDSAFFWTDPRYFIQAEEQLNPKNFQLMRQQQGVAAPIHEWLAKHANNKRVATDPKLLSVAEQKLWSQALEPINGQLISISENFVDAIWNDRPQRHKNPIIHLDEQFSGKSTQTKLKELREALQENDAKAHAINLLDAIAWLFNIRGTDIQYNPLAISYALVTENKATLFIDATQVDDVIKKRLAAEGVDLAPYDSFAKALNELKEPTLLEPSTASWWMAQELKNCPIILANSPITLMKAIKNPIEQKGMAEAHRRDGLALCRIFYWLRQNWRGQTELSVSKVVSECREKDDHFRGLSFSTISAYAGHSAIPHYFVDEESSVDIGDDTLFLLDSGGQYFEGTTDVTRTVHLGTPKPHHIHHYTLVLKGHLALKRTVFPHGTCGEQLNAIAHQPLWNEGLDFGHGTGHGVGCYLCVHEGPQRISSAYTHTPIVPGMVLSNEPGVYFANEYGIRIENLVVVVEKFKIEESKTGHGPFYGFENLTLYPYERNLIDKTMLSEIEIRQVNDYHQLVFDKLHNDLSKEMQEWLKAATLPL